MQVIHHIDKIKANTIHLSDLFANSFFSTDYLMCLLVLNAENICRICSTCYHSVALKNGPICLEIKEVFLTEYHEFCQFGQEDLRTWFCLEKYCQKQVFSAETLLQERAVAANFFRAIWHSNIILSATAGAFASSWYEDVNILEKCFLCDLPHLSSCPERQWGLCLWRLSKLDCTRL